MSFLDWILLLVRVVLALLVSLDIKATVCLYVLKCVLTCIALMHITLRGTYIHYSLAVLEVIKTIKKVKGVSKKPETHSNSNDMELPPTVSSTSIFVTSTTVAVVMKQESLIQGEDDNL